MKRITILFLLLLSACAPSPVQNNPQIDLAIAAAQLTSTAQVVEWTSTAQVSQWTATAQSWTPTPSLTPVPTSTPTVTLTPTVDVTGTLAVVMMQEEINDIQRANTRKDATNTVLAWLPYLVFGLAIGLAVFFGFVGVKRFSMMPTPVHEGTGKPMPMINVVDGVVSDIDRAPNGMAVMNKKYVAGLPAITAERQAAVTNNAQLVDAQSRRAKLPRELVQSQSRPMLEAPAQLPAGNDANALFPLPAWELVNGWQGEKNILPYGLTASGLGMVNVDEFPHMATIGKTGEGKSRRFFRPLIACALAAGHQVVVVGKTTDYVVFASHPNMTIVKVAQMTEPEHAARYVAILKALVEEMNRRDDYLTSANRSTWAQAGRTRTFVVLDELGNAMRLMPSNMAEQTRIWVEGLVSEGRKVGFNVAVANQRATGMAGILSQTGKAIFRVERDEEKAHRSLTGASSLREGYFLARFGDVKLAGAFEPTDEQIARFLASRPVPALESDWVDGRIVETFNAALPTQPGIGSLPEPEPTPTPTADDEMTKNDIARVVQLLSTGATPSAVVRAVFGVSGGGKFLRLNDKVKEIKSSLEGVV